MRTAFLFSFVFAVMVSLLSCDTGTKMNTDSDAATDDIVVPDDLLVTDQPSFDDDEAYPDDLSDLEQPDTAAVDTQEPDEMEDSLTSDIPPDEIVDGIVPDTVDVQPDPDLVDEDTLDIDLTDEDAIDTDMMDEDIADVDLVDEDADATDNDMVYSGIVCTGQTKCYDNGEAMTCPSVGLDLYGQDAQYAVLGYCVPKSYTVSGIAPEEIVTDNNTGLQWQRAFLSGRSSWNDALLYACDGVAYGGFNDWRLPSDRELESIVDYGRYNPSIDTEAFPDTSFVEHWSSLVRADNAEYAWSVSFDYGYVRRRSIYNLDYSARCVRGDPLPASAFTVSIVNEKVIVTDTATGLIWTKECGGPVTWQNALGHCENSDYAGYTDWRLPNINELRTLVNRELFSPASDFPDMPADGLFWSSSSYASLTAFAWGVGIDTGGVFNTSKGVDGLACCVR
ncbi:MAG TPA: DUF1566 domain-containing protein [bacterium]|nr:DUF1566 domain-containing protein [bacterium]